MEKTINDLEKLVQATNPNFRVVFKGDIDYDESREIANSRIQLYPAAIAYCTIAEDVASCIEYCKENNVQFRVRSGGHQHEGMSSANNVLIIDLSEIYDAKIEYLLGADTAWIPAGKKLGVIYEELEKRIFTLPGGGCQSVCVGGLTQGGGWGLSTRKKGMTCDNILAVEIVIPNGEIVIARADNEYKDLFWAIRGGGGGNFGVITKYLFQLTPLPPAMTTFSLRWKRDKMYDVALAWINMHYDPNTSNNLTMGCRLMVTAKKPMAEAIIVSGQLYGNIQETLAVLQPLFSVAKPIHENYEVHNYPERAKPKSTLKQYKTSSLKMASAPSNNENNTTFLAAQQGYLGSLLQPAARNPKTLEPPKQTCDAPHPHKITSAFPKDNLNKEQLVRKMVEYVENSTITEGANQYMTLHSMGGKVMDKAPNDTAFFYRNKPFMLQVQAWWTDSGDVNEDKQNDKNLVEWVENYRTYLEEHIEGAFINFVDKDLVKDISTPEGRKEILSYYYGKNLDRLMEVKSKYDEHNLFNFEMSIPLK